MIREISANQKGFKSVEFSTGLNVILAERTQEFGHKDTRNGAGKTTLLNIINFCLSGDLNRLSLPKDDLQDWVFSIKIDLCGKTVTAKQSIANANVVEVETEVAGLPIMPEKKPEGMLFYKNDDWKNLLGQCLFNIQKESTAKYKPSFRSLVSYFIRRGEDAYTDPFKHFRHQKTYDLQIHNAYLLDLNWQHAREAQEIRDKENTIKALNSAIKTGMMADQGELQAERVRIEHELKQESDAITSFNVHPQYRKPEKTQLETKLQRDYQQNRTEWEKAITLFNENSQALYEEPSNLIINTNANGYKFDVKIHKSSSEGIGKMKIFCYDLMLVLLMKQKHGIDFLFHDSSIFHGVDSRQIALALMYANRKASENNFQYICALNSDMIPEGDFEDGFTIDAFVRLTLKDQKPCDAALGFHFELEKKKHSR